MRQFGQAQHTQSLSEAVDGLGSRTQQVSKEVSKLATAVTDSIRSMSDQIADGFQQYNRLLDKIAKKQLQLEQSR